MQAVKKNVARSCSILYIVIMSIAIAGIGAEIRRLRLKKGWSAARLSREAKAASVAMLERGERLDPRLSQIVAIARALGVTVDAIVDKSGRRRAPR